MPCDPTVRIRLLLPNHAFTVHPRQLRKHMARKVFKARQAARMWNVLDNYNEEMNLRRGKKLSQATKLLRSEINVEKTDTESLSVGLSLEDDPRVGRAASVSSSDDDLDDLLQFVQGKTVEDLQDAAGKAVQAMTVESLSALEVDRSKYKGCDLRHPVQLTDVLEMLESFKRDEVLHYKSMMLLLLQAKTIFAEENTVQEIVIPDDKVRVTIVGDLHGQLLDVFTIFTINGLPSATNWYLFNGDFVDRGTKGCEIIATLCAFKILYPSFVFLNRGNHEARAQNAWMGFEEELLTKYAAGSSCVALKTKDRLASLKLYMLCEELFDALPLCGLIQERVFVCHGGLFRNDGVTLNHLRSIARFREPPLEGRSMEEKVYEDLLWSDPRPTATFPKPLKTKRASDRGAGCEFGPLVTNRFCAMNQVALIVRSHECVPEGFEVLHNGRLITIFSASRYCGTQTNKGAFITFAHDLQPEIQQFYAQSVDTGSFITDEQRNAKLEDEAIHMLVEQICDKKLDLYWYFTQNDVEHTGLVTRVEWAAALKTVLGLDLPFLHYQPRLATVHPKTRMINYSQFLSRFQIHVRKEDATWQDALVRRVCEKLYESFGTDLKSAFSEFDKNNDGVIQFQEFIQVIKKLDTRITDEEVYDLMRSIDENDDAHIDFKEFAERFKLGITSCEAGATQGAIQPPTLKNSNVVERVSNMLYQNRIHLKSCFRSLDVEGRGYILKKDFELGLKRVSTAFENALTKVEIDELCKSLDKNEDGKIDYKEFFEGLSISF